MARRIIDILTNVETYKSFIWTNLSILNTNIGQ